MCVFWFRDRDTQSSLVMCQAFQGGTVLTGMWPWEYGVLAEQPGRGHIATGSAGALIASKRALMWPEYVCSWVRVEAKG